MTDKELLLSDKERATFRDAMRGASSWESTPTARSAFDDSMPATFYSPTQLDHIPRTEWVDGDSLLRFSHPGVSSRRLRKLAAGKLFIERTVDFHGLTGDDIQEALEQAIHAARLDSIRLLLVIHGKGSNADAARPAILKNYLNQSLRQNPDVLAFHSAKPAHGGSGAMYVLLRKPTT